MLDLTPYRLALQPAPPPVRSASKAVVAAPVPRPTEARALLAGSSAPRNEIRRDADGRVLVTCVTDMPGVTPAMIDWWFGWHLPASERYRLWHPQAHVAASVKEDRSDLSDDRARYVGNVSYVDEYIGRRLMKLAIAFVTPADFGWHDVDAQGATVVCGWTHDRILRGRGGCLTHYVIPVRGGAQMRSAFWLGEVTHEVPWIDSLLHPWLNTRWARQRFVPNGLARNLLIHCGEEMNHLARFLPALYRDVIGETTIHRHTA